MWLPTEIILNTRVEDDPITQHILQFCKDVPVRRVNDSISTTVTKASTVLQEASKDVLSKIKAGKQVLHITSFQEDSVDLFDIKDKRMLCPEFDKLTLASNGCYYHCDWCYLKLTYRNAFPYISVRTEYEKAKEHLAKVIQNSVAPIMFDTGEMADSLSMEHLTKSGQEFIPWFGEQKNGYMYMLTKSDNVEDLLPLQHNSHTIMAWSLNAPEVSEKWEVGAPSFEQRLAAAKKVQDAGYPLRIRLDPIVPIDGWQDIYAKAIQKIFSTVDPERITLGTLRFERPLYKQRKKYFTCAELVKIVGRTAPMLDEDYSTGKKLQGKYTFSADQRIEVFKFALDEIRKHSKCDVALCKETNSVWKAVGLDPADVRCVCKLHSADLSSRPPEAGVPKKLALMSEKPKKSARQPISNPDKHVKNKIYPLLVDMLQPDPNQPRKYFDSESMAELECSIEKHGVLQPIIFRQDETGQRIIIAGERRVQAVKKLNKKIIPGIYNDGDPAEIALIENMLRENLTALEEAEALKNLKDNSDYKLADLASFLGKAESTVSEILSLNKLTKKIKEACRQDSTVSRRVLIEIAKEPNRRKMAGLWRRYQSGLVKPQEAIRAQRLDLNTEATTLLRFAKSCKGALEKVKVGDLNDEMKQKIREAISDLKASLDSFDEQ